MRVSLVVLTVHAVLSAPVAASHASAREADADHDTGDDLHRAPRRRFIRAEVDESRAAYGNEHVGPQTRRSLTELPLESDCAPGRTATPRDTRVSANAAAWNRVRARMSGLWLSRGKAWK